MKKKLLKVILIFAVVFSQSSFVFAEVNNYDPQHTMLALNMAIVSINKMLTTKSRVVLEQEYQNIINNLSLGNIESDSDMTALYKNMMTIISRKRLREEDSKHLQTFYNAAEKRLITYALSNIKLTQAEIKNSENKLNDIQNDISEINSSTA